MSQLAAQTSVRILVLDSDPSSGQLLHDLCRLIPEPKCNVSLHQAAADLLPEGLSEFRLCFLARDYVQEGLEVLVKRLHDEGNGPDIFCLLTEEELIGDRQETARLIRAGVADFLVRDELSVKQLRELLHSALPKKKEPAPSPLLPLFDAAAVNETGHWEMDLLRRTACFDPTTMSVLGYTSDEIGDSLADWKALIHPLDIDRLIRELNQVLEGEAPPHPIGYRVRRADGGWIEVLSGEVDVHMSPTGTPERVIGSFFVPEPAGGHVAATAPPTEEAFDKERVKAFDLSPMPKLLLRTSASDVKVAAINEAAREISSELRLGMPLADLAKLVGDFDLDASVSRVSDCGIAEHHQVELVDAEGLPYLRELCVSRTDELTLLIEMLDSGPGTSPRADTPAPTEPFWRQILGSVPDIVLLLDETGTVKDLVAGSLDSFALSADELIEAPVSQLLGEEAGALCINELTRSLNTGKRIEFGCETKANDSTLWLNCRISPLSGQPGEARRSVFTARDLTAQKRELELIGNTRQQFRDALYRVPAILYLKDADGRYLLVNPYFEALFGIEEEKVIGKTDFEIFPDSLATEIYSADRQVLDTLEPFEQVFTVNNNNSTRRFRRFNYPVCDAEGNLSAVCCLCIGLDRFVGETAAEGPEAEVQLAISALASRTEQAAIGETQGEAIQLQLNNLQHFISCANTLLMQAQQDPDDSGSQRFQTGQLLNNLLEFERAMLPRTVSLREELAPELPEIHASPSAFKTLILRAMRHMRQRLRNHDSGTLSVHARQIRISPRGCASCMELVEGDYVEIVIEESLSEPLVQDLQQRFSQHVSEKTAGSGSGNLGAIHRLIHQFGGHLLVQQGIPRGSSLYLLFRPRSDDYAAVDDPLAKVTRLPLGEN